MNWLRTNKDAYYYRYAISVGLTVFVAVLLNHYYSYSGEGWIVLAAFLASQTTRGAPIRQGLLISVNVVAAIFASAIMVSEINQSVFIYFMTALIFIVGAYIAYMCRPLTSKALFLAIIFPLIILIATLAPVNMGHIMHDRVMDAIVGCLLGVLCSHFILPIQAYKEFSRGLVPELKALESYSLKIEDYFLHQKHVEWAKERSNVCAIQNYHYPEWVYEVGFNPGLRSGFRFFLINIERITEVLYSMSYLSTNKVESSLLRVVELSLSHAMHKNNELLFILKEFFEQKKLSDVISDYTTDIAALESDLRRVVPGSLELLDMNPDYLTLTAFVRNIKDMREILLQLVLALPTYQEPT